MSPRWRLFLVATSALALTACGASPPPSPTAPARPPAATTPSAPSAEPSPEARPPWFLEAEAEPGESRPAPFDLAAVVAERRRGPVAGFVVAADEARLFPTEAAARAHRADAADLPRIDVATARGDTSTSGTLLRVVQDHGDVVAVDTMRSASGHCSDSRSPFPLSWLELRLFVRKADLLPLLSQDVELPFEDGSGVSAPAGTLVGLPVVPWHGEPAIHAAGYSIEVPLVAADIGLSYRPSTFRVPRRNLDYRMPERPLRLRGRPWLRKSRFGSAPALIPSREGLAEIHSDCVTLFLAADEVVEESRGGGGVAAIGGGGTGRRRKPPKKKRVMREYVRKDGAVMWPDGSKAGTVRYRRRLTDDPLPAGSTTPRHLRCYVFDDEAPIATPLCLPPATIERVQEEIIVR